MLVTFTPPLPQGEGTTVLGSDGCSYVIKGGCPIVAPPVDIDTVDGYSLPGIAPEGVTDSNTGEPIKPGAQVTVYFGPDGNIIGYKDCTDADTFATTVIAADAGADDANNEYPAGAMLLMTVGGELFCMKKTPGSMLIVAGSDGTDDASNPYSQGDELIQLSDGSLICAKKPDELGPSVIINPDDPATWPADSGAYDKQCLTDINGNSIGYVDATGVHLVVDEDDEVGPDVIVDPLDAATWPPAPAAPHAVQFLCDASGNACAILTASGAKRIPKPVDEIGPAIAVDPDDSSTWPTDSGDFKKQCLTDAAGNMIGFVDANGPHFTLDEDNEVGPDIIVDPDDPASWPTSPVAPHDLQFLCDANGNACAILTALGPKKITKPQWSDAITVPAGGTYPAAPTLPGTCSKVFDPNGNFIGTVDDSGPHPLPPPALAKCVVTDATPCAPVVESQPVLQTDDVLTADSIVCANQVVTICDQQFAVTKKAERLSWAFLGNDEFRPRPNGDVILETLCINLPEFPCAIEIEIDQYYQVAIAEFNYMTAVVGIQNATFILESQVSIDCGQTWEPLYNAFGLGVMSPYLAETSIQGSTVLTIPAKTPNAGVQLRLIKFGETGTAPVPMDTFVTYTHNRAVFSYPEFCHIA